MCTQRTAEMQGGEFTGLGKIWAFGLALALLLASQLAASSAAGLMTSSSVARFRKTARLR